jgi:hypothetical protein
LLIKPKLYFCMDIVTQVKLVLFWKTTLCFQQIPVDQDIIFWKESRRPSPPGHFHLKHILGVSEELRIRSNLSLLWLWFQSYRVNISYILISEASHLHDLIKTDIMAAVSYYLTALLLRVVATHTYSGHTDSNRTEWHEQFLVQQ